MKPLKVEEVARAVGGVLNNPKIGQELICGVSFDTRDDLKNKLFVAFKGQNVDGHDFLHYANEMGAVCGLSQRETCADAIIVPDTGKALADLAHYYLSLFDVKVVGITGSSGKTSTKDMVAAVLSEKYNVVKTKGNFNNEIGLPITIFNITEDTEVAVLEMGMNNRHEIHRLSKIANPHMAIITNIGTAHIENLGSQEEIFKAKSEIMDFLAADGPLFLHGDDKFLQRHKDRLQVVFYGHGGHNHYKIEDETPLGLKGSTYKTTLKYGENLEIFVPTPGGHMVLNSLAAVAVGDYMGLTPAQIARGLANFKITGMRMEILETKSLKIIADCYNANPASMKAALEVLAAENGQKVAILGDMFELGENSAVMHGEVGEVAANLPISTLITIGSHSDAISHAARGASFKGKILHFQNKEDFLGQIRHIINAGDIVLVKASRGMQFEKIVSFLEEYDA